VIFLSLFVADMSLFFRCYPAVSPLLFPLFLDGEHEKFQLLGRCSDFREFFRCGRATLASPRSSARSVYRRPDPRLIGPVFPPEMWNPKHLLLIFFRRARPRALAARDSFASLERTASFVLADRYGHAAA